MKDFLKPLIQMVLLVLAIYGALIGLYWIGQN
jgi:hypothetical protein